MVMVRCHFFVPKCCICSAAFPFKTPPFLLVSPFSQWILRPMQPRFPESINDSLFMISSSWIFPVSVDFLDRSCCCSCFHCCRLLSTHVYRALGFPCALLVPKHPWHVTAVFHPESLASVVCWSCGCLRTNACISLDLTDWWHVWVGSHSVFARDY